MLLLALTALALAQDSPSREGEGSGDEDDTVVVEGERDDGPDPAMIPAVVTVIEVDERLPAAHDLGEVVAATAGATVQRLGGLGDFAAVSIRGSSFRQVTVCLDGIPLNPEGSAAVDLSELPLRAFQRVEIYRGNAPPGLGTPAMGGVVNLVTGEDPPPPSVAASYGSWRTGRIFASTGVSASLGEQPTDLLLVADALHSKGDHRYFSDGGTSYNALDDHVWVRDNNHKSQLAAHGRWRVGPPGRRLTVLDAFLSRSAGLPGHGDAPASLASLDLTRNALVVEAEAGGISGGRLRLFHHLRDERLDDRAGELGVGGAWTRDRTTAAGMQLRATWAPRAVLGGTLSMRRDAWTGWDLVSEGEPDTRTRLAVGLAADAALWTWSDRLLVAPVVEATALLDQAAVDPEVQPLAGEGTELLWLPSPRLGVLLRPHPSLALKANGGRYGRPPDLLELFGDRGAAKGNAALLPEKGWAADAGARWEPGEHLVVEGYGFWNEASDLIVWMQNAQQVSVPANVGRARVRGVEAAASAAVARHLEASASLTRTWSTSLSGSAGVLGNPLPSVPAWELSTRAAWVQGAWLRAGHTYSLTDGEYRDATATRRAAPRSIHGVFARVEPGRGLPSVEVDVLNLLDRIVDVVPRNPLDPDDGERVVQPLTDFVGYPLPGRTLMVTVRWEAP